MTPEHLARSYYRKINEKDLAGVLSLFADDATFNLPDGRVVSGKPEIAAMYENVFAQGGPQPQPVHIVSSDTGVAVEVEVRLADGAVLQMASFFELGLDDRFSRVAVYRRG